MKCPKCNINVSDDSQFCPNCGIKIYEYKAEEPKENLPNNNSNTSTQGHSESQEGCIIVLVMILGLAIMLAIGLGVSFITILLTSIFIAICIIAWKLAPKTKNIVVSIGRKTLDFLTILDVILCVIVIVLGFIQCVSEDGISSLLWWYILGAVVLFFGTLLANYTLYLLIDIRDSLKKLSDKKGE